MSGWQPVLHSQRGALTKDQLGCGSVQCEQCHATCSGLMQELTPHSVGLTRAPAFTCPDCCVNCSLGSVAQTVKHLLRADTFLCLLNVLSCLHLKRRL